MLKTNKTIPLAEVVTFGPGGIGDDAAGAEPESEQQDESNPDANAESNAQISRGLTAFISVIGHGSEL